MQIFEHVLDGLKAVGAGVGMTAPRIINRFENDTIALIFQV